jgi:hypothetical protein
MIQTRLYTGEKPYTEFMETVTPGENIRVHIPHLQTGVFKRYLPEHINTISFILESKFRCNRILDIRGHYPVTSPERYLYNKVYVYLNVFQLEGIIVDTEEEYEITKYAYGVDMREMTYDLAVYWRDQHEMFRKKF